MTIHTVEIRYQFPKDEAEKIIIHLKKRCPSRASELDNFLEKDKAKIFKTFTNLYMGVLALNMYKHKYYPSVDIIYLTITLDLEVFCLGEKTNGLFIANAYNVRVLEERYVNFIYEIFCDCFYQLPIYNENGYTNIGIGAIPHLHLCKVNRIDYAMNIYCDQKELFLKLAKASYLGGRKQDTKFKGNSNIYAVTKGRKRITSLYDKELYYGYKNITDKDILEEARELVRYEVPIIKPNAAWLASYKKDSVFEIGVYPFLSEEVAKAVLTKEYEKIRFSDWYNDWYMKKMINDSDYSKAIKAKLIDIAQIISQSRSVKKALINYTAKGYTIAKSHKVVEGTRETFYKYLKYFNELGIQPFRIPDRWCSKYDVSWLENPIFNEVLTGTKKHNSTGYSIPNEAKMIYDYVREGVEIPYLSG